MVVYDVPENLHFGQERQLSLKNGLPDVTLVKRTKQPLRKNRYCHMMCLTIGVDIFTFHGQDYLLSADYLSNFFEIDRLQSKR